MKKCVCILYSKSSVQYRMWYWKMPSFPAPYQSGTSCAEISWVVSLFLFTCCLSALLLNSCCICRVWVAIMSGSHCCCGNRIGNEFTNGLMYGCGIYLSMCNPSSLWAEAFPVASLKIQELDRQWSTTFSVSGVVLLFCRLAHLSNGNVIHWMIIWASYSVTSIIVKLSPHCPKEKPVALS